jgi:hypothetical protein
LKPETLRLAQRFILVGLSLTLAMPEFLSGVMAETSWWDLRVYLAAIRFYQEGGNPYLRGFPDLRYIYAPLVTWIWALILPILPQVLLAFYLAAAAAFLTLDRGRFALAALLTGGLHVCGGTPLFSAVWSGNTSLYLHFAIIACALHRPWLVTRVLFYGLVVGASLIKPYFAAYLLAPMLMDNRFARADILRLLAATGLIAALWLVQFLIDPDLFRAFLDALRMQSFGVAFDPAYSDMGAGFYRVWAMLSGDFLLAGTLHFVTAAALIGLWILVARPGLLASGFGAEHPVFKVAPLVLVILLNPRLKIYDYAALEILLVYLLVVFDLPKSNRWFVWLHPLIPLLVIHICTDIFGVHFAKTAFTEVPELLAIHGALLIAALYYGLFLHSRRPKKPART